MKKTTLKLLSFIALSAITTQAKAQFTLSGDLLTSDNGIDRWSFHSGTWPRAINGNTTSYFQLYANNNQDNGPSLFMFTGATAFADQGTIRFQSTNSTVSSTTSSFEVVNHPNSSTWSPLFKVRSNGNTEVSNDLKVNGTVNTWNVLAQGNGYIDGYLRIGSMVSLPGSTPTTPGGEPKYRLYVQNGILTEKLKVAVKNLGHWSDFVFADDYELASLDDVENFINKNKHLPGVPSAEEVVKEGIDVATMDAKLLQKIEELTLYVIQQQKEIQDLKKQISK